MGHGLSKIIPGLFVGGIGDARDLKHLQEHGVTHMLSVHDHAGPMHNGEVMQMCLNLSDSPDVNIAQHFIPAAKFIHAARKEKGTVLVHCLAGVSRSVSITASYLMLVGNVGWIDALKIIRFTRLGANPNIGFKRQLREFEASIAESRDLFRKEFPLEDDLAAGLNDVETVQAALAKQRRSLGSQEQEIELEDEFLQKQFNSQADNDLAVNGSKPESEDDGIQFIDSDPGPVRNNLELGQGNCVQNGIAVELKPKRLESDAGNTTES